MFLALANFLGRKLVPGSIGDEGSGSGPVVWENWNTDWENLSDNWENYI